MTANTFAALQADLDHIAARAADLRVSFQAEIDDEGTIFLSDIGRDLDDPTTKGSGATVMTALCRAADLFDVYFETSCMTAEAGLRAYYERFGLLPYGEPGDITNLRREPSQRAIPINGTTLTRETVLRTREHFAELSRASVEEIRSGVTKVSDPAATIAWFEEGAHAGLAGEGDHSVTFRQRALWIQTGQMPPVLAPSAERREARPSAGWSHQAVSEAA